MPLAAAVFKTQCLSLMEKVRGTRVPITITKRGKPVAVLAPYTDSEHPAVFGRMKGLARLTDDLVAPTDESWEAEK